MGMYLFNEYSFRKQKEYNTITIYVGKNKMNSGGDENNSEELIDDGSVITAVLQDEFKFGVKADWKQILTAGGFSDTIEKAMLVTGNKVHNAGGITKQYYMGSEHIPISVKFRIFAGQTGTSPLKAVETLTRLCLPPNGASIQSYLDELKDTGVTILNSAKALVEDLGTGEGFIKALNQFFASLTGNVGNEVCYVTFGKWLAGFFVVKSADFTYSRELSVDGGPYYIDFDVTFETLMVPSKGMVSSNPEVSQGRRTTFNLGTSRPSRIEIT